VANGGEIVSYTWALNVLNFDTVAYECCNFINQKGLQLHKVGSQRVLDDDVRTYNTRTYKIHSPVCCLLDDGTGLA